MQITFFSFIMSLLWFNLYIVIINNFRKNDKFIISFSTFPLIFFLALSVFRLIFSFDNPSSLIISSREIFPRIYDFMRRPLKLEVFSMDIFQLLILVWVTVAIVLVVANTIKYRDFKKGLRELYESRNKRNEESFREILSLKGKGEKMRVIQHDSISSPFIIGIGKGVIYLPNTNLSREEMEYIISHEVNHFLANDSLKKILVQMIKYVFWWNPFSHLFANNFNHILEIQCDLRTTADFSDQEKIAYLEAITSVINNQTEDMKRYESIPNLINIRDIDSLKQRFRIVLNYKNKRNLFKVFNLALSALAVSFFIGSYFVIIQPHYDPINAEEYIEGDKAESFIIENPDGNYDVYINSIYQYSIKTLEDLNESLSDMPVYEGARQNDSK